MMTIPGQTDVRRAGVNEMLDQHDVGSWQDLRDQQSVPHRCIIHWPRRISLFRRRPLQVQVTSVLTDLEEPVHVHRQPSRAGLLGGQRQKAEQLTFKVFRSAIQFSGDTHVWAVCEVLPLWIKSLSSYDCTSLITCIGYEHVKTPQVKTSQNWSYMVGRQQKLRR